ncbi:hypothetical protein QBC46DRAFT_453737 [Diplogelasinospora grovesii]|uniref:Fungal N-terminal domain-containing protein n=1 Tax=Diplogelasinospora grovesii TaxID=303347 RepID=A0AAN6MYA1_9PEZI|nr:hypothetical protein QBC46DRAFT_453737 [Diplogelasinospora grovesii]
MAEVLGFVTIGLSLAKATKSIASFVKTLYDVAKQAPSVGDQMRRIALQLQTASLVFGTVRASLEHHRPKNLDSPAIQYLARFKVIQALVKESDHIGAEIRARRRNMWLIPRRFAWWTSWKWNQMKPHIEALGPSIESLKASLQIIILIIQVEQAPVAMAGRSQAELEEEIAFLKKVIEDQIETIRLLREQDHIIPTKVSATSPSERAASQMPDQQIALCHLARSMAETQTVPNTPPETFSFSEPAKTHQRQRRRRKQPTSDIFPAASSSHTPTTRSVRQERPRSEAFSNVTTPEVRVAPYVPRTRVPRPRSEAFPPPSPSNPSSEEQHSREPITRPTMPEPLARQASGASPASTSRTQTSSSSTPSTSSTSHGRKSTDTAAASRGSDALMTGPPPLALTVEEGYIISGFNNRRIRATARVEQRLGVNLISLAYAKQLHFEIKVLGPVSISFPQENGETPRELLSMGKVMIRWNKSARTATGTLVYIGALSYTPVNCLVCESLEEPLIFGRHWWRDEESRGEHL